MPLQDLPGGVDRADIGKPPSCTCDCQAPLKLSTRAPPTRGALPLPAAAAIARYFRRRRPSCCGVGGELQHCLVPGMGSDNTLPSSYQARWWRSPRITRRRYWSVPFIA